MDGIGDHPADWNNPDLERQVSCLLWCVNLGFINNIETEGEVFGDGRE